MRRRLGIGLAVVVGLLAGQPVTPAQDAAMKQWWSSDLRAVLTGPKGDQRFHEDYEGTLLPVMPPLPAPFFKGRIVAMSPAVNPTMIVLSVEREADAILFFRKALPGSMPIGSELSFRGALRSFKKERFAVSFDVSGEIEGAGVAGWPGVAAPVAPLPGPRRGQQAR